MMLKIFALFLCLFVINSTIVDARTLKSRVCTVDKLSNSLEFSAVRKVLSAVRNNPPGVLRSATVGSYTVWARARCFADDCFACVSELVNKVWGFCDNAKGKKSLIKIKISN